MGKFYLDLLEIGEIPSAYLMKSEQMMAISGLNFGNFAFRHALRFILEELNGYVPVNWVRFHALRTESVESVIVSCANWLGVSPQDEASNGNRARALEAIPAPTVCFGLGVQAKSGEGLPKLGPNTTRLAQILSERSKRLSVRDQITQDTLEGIGVTNTVVTGCPSNFINGAADLGRRVADRSRQLGASATNWNQIRTATSEFSGGHAASGLVLKEQMRLMDVAPAFLLIQSPMLLPLLLNETVDVPNVYVANRPAGWSAEKLVSVLRAKTLHFTSVEGWLDFSRTCDLSVGMRIHGAMVPLQAGVPSLLLSHDSRTSGLASVMGVPTIAPEEFVRYGAEKPATLFEIIANSMEGYDDRRRRLARVMHDYVVENGLIPHQSLTQLSGQDQRAAS